MMRTFDVITVFGTGNARAMADGISVALITTQTGLMVSIPGLYMTGGSTAGPGTSRPGSVPLGSI